MALERAAIVFFFCFERVNVKLERVFLTGERGCVDNWVAYGDSVASQKDRVMM